MSEERMFHEKLLDLFGITETRGIQAIRAVCRPRKCSITIRYITPGKNGNNYRIVEGALQTHVKTYTFDIDTNNQIVRALENK